jgi:hypothetical protein
MPVSASSRGKGKTRSRSISAAGRSEHEREALWSHSPESREQPPLAVHQPSATEIKAILKKKRPARREFHTNVSSATMSKRV